MFFNILIFFPQSQPALHVGSGRYVLNITATVAGAYRAAISIGGAVIDTAKAVVGLVSPAAVAANGCVMYGSGLGGSAAESTARICVRGGDQFGNAKPAAPLISLFTIVASQNGVGTAFSMNAVAGSDVCGDFMMMLASTGVLTIL